MKVRKSLLLEHVDFKDLNLGYAQGRKKTSKGDLGKVNATEIRQKNIEWSQKLEAGTRKDEKFKKGLAECILQRQNIERYLLSFFLVRKKQPLHSAGILSVKK